MKRFHSHSLGIRKPHRHSFSLCNWPQASESNNSSQYYFVKFPLSRRSAKFSFHFGQGSQIFNRFSIFSMSFVLQERFPLFKSSFDNMHTVYWLFLISKNLELKELPIGPIHGVLQFKIIISMLSGQLFLYRKFHLRNATGEWKIKTS